AFIATTEDQITGEVFEISAGVVFHTSVEDYGTFGRVRKSGWNDQLMRIPVIEHFVPGSSRHHDKVVEVREGDFDVLIHPYFSGTQFTFSGKPLPLDFAGSVPFDLEAVERVLETYLCRSSTDRISEETPSFQVR